MAGPILDSLAARFPRLEHLWASWRGSRIPFVAQLTNAECGLACLSMVAGYYGRYVALEDLRRRVTLQPGVGVSAQMLLELGRDLGLRGRAVMADLREVIELPPGSVLHWELTHFVVLVRATAEALEVLDPAAGRVRVPMAEVAKAYTGVAVLLEPGEGFEKKATPPSPVARIAREMLGSDAWVPLVTVSLLIQMLAFALPALTALVVDRVLPLGDRDLHTLLWVLTGCVGGVYFLAQLVRARLAAWLVLKAAAQLRLSMMERMLGARMRFYYERSPDDLAGLVSTTDAVMNVVSSAMLSGVIDSVLALTFLSVLMISDPAVGSVALAIAGLQFAFVWLSSKKLLELEVELQSKSRQHAVVSSEALHGVEAVKSLGLERRVLTMVMNQDIDVLNVQRGVRSLTGTYDAFHGTIRFIGPLVVLLVGSGRAMDGHISFGHLFSLAALAGAVLTPVGLLSTAMSMLPRIRALIARLADVVAAPQERTGDGGASIRLSGEVKLTDVTFRYGEMSPPAVRNVTLAIRPGEFLAIVGASGSGKSTLAGLLVGLLTPDSGRVEFDGQDLRTLDLFSVRAQIGYVPQRPFLFSRSIRENISSGDPMVSMDDIVSAAKAAAIHEEVSALALGYDTGVTNFAVFSGGQRQRLSVARALVRRPKVLILDEATSAVDTITERTIQHNVESLNATRVVVAHRLSTVRNAHRLALMHAGSLLDVGTWDELLARQPLFVQMCEAAEKTDA